MGAPAGKTVLLQFQIEIGGGRVDLQLNVHFTFVWERLILLILQDLGFL